MLGDSLYAFVKSYKLLFKERSDYTKVMPQSSLTFASVSPHTLMCGFEVQGRATLCPVVLGRQPEISKQLTKARFEFYWQEPHAVFPQSNWSQAGIPRQIVNSEGGKAWVILTSQVDSSLSTGDSWHGNFHW